ncbi:MAG: hypothetical protein R6X20_15775 [Phycisphaerae bacterium]
MIFREPPTRTRPDGARPSSAGLAAVADLLLSGPSRSRAAGTGSAPAPAPEPPPDPAPEADLPRGLYVLVPAGIDPSARREAVLAAAGSLASPPRPAAVLLFEGGRVDAHVLGETACGRLGPQGYLGGPDLGQAVRRLVDHCDPVALVPLDAPEALLDRRAPALEHPVFLVEADAESLVEAYRTLKAWRRSGAAGRSAVLFAGRPSHDAAPLHTRLRVAARAFLGCDLARQRVRNGDASPPEAAAPGIRLFAGAPAEAVWAPLLDAGTAPSSPPGTEALRAAAPPPEPSAPAAAPVDAAPPAVRREAEPVPAVRPAFALWQPDSREDLLAVFETQLPALLGPAYRHVFRVDVAEPGAPPLVAVRDDGTLVAILFGELDEVVPTRPAQAWLRVHWPLLVRVWPDAGLPDQPRVATMVLAAARPDRSDASVRQFVPVRLGGHKGIVLLG